MSYNCYSNKQNIISICTDTNKNLLDSFADWVFFIDKISMTISKDYPRLKKALTDQNISLK